MILENVFYAEIKMDKDDFEEFVCKGWYALNVHKEYPDEKIGQDAFLDWARDLTWIEEKHIVIVIKGNINDDTRDMINLLNKYWEDKWQNSKKPEYKKKVEFILVG